MTTTALRIHRFRKIRWLYLAGFVAYLHLNFVLYVNSSFIADIIGEKFVGTIYILGAVGSLVAVIGASRILREIGNYRALIIVTCLEMALLLGLATASNPYLLLLLNVVFLALEPALFFCLDIFLENYTHPDDGEKDVTGGV